MQREHKPDPCQSLNFMQENEIKGILYLSFHDFRKLPPDVAINALRLLTGIMVLSKKDKAIIENQDVWRTILYINKILKHEYPQNRCKSSDDFTPSRRLPENHVAYQLVDQEFDKMIDVKSSTLTKVVFKNGKVIQGENLTRYLPSKKYLEACEREGLLGLTALEDDRTPPVIKKSVSEYIQQLIKIEIEHHQKRKDQIKTASPGLFSFKKQEMKSEMVSLIQDKQNISKDNWLVCFAIDKDNQKAMIYLEGMFDDSVFSWFITRYAFDKFNGVSIQMVHPEHFNRSNFLQIQATIIDRVQAQRLIQSMKNDISFFQGRSHSLSYSQSKTADKDNTSVEWAIRKLKQIHIIVDRDFNNPNIRSYVQR